MTTDHYVPRARSMSVKELFRVGPWQLIVPWWIGGALIVAVWLAFAPARWAAVASPALGTIAGASLAGMAGVIARSRYVHRPGAGWPLVVALMVFGGVGGWAASRFLFHPRMARAGECAPLVAAGVSPFAVYFAYVLPPLLWLLWCRYLIAGLRGVGENLDANRILAFSRQLLRILPLRGLLTLLVLGLAVALIATRHRTGTTVTPAALVATLQRGDAESLAVLHDPETKKRIEAQRLQAARAARARLAALDLDGARPLVRGAVCEMALPGAALEPDLVAAEGAFAQLDGEIDYEFATWRPTAGSGRTILELLPLGDDPAAPRFPFLRSQASGSVSTEAQPSVARVDVMYRSEKVMEAWVLALQSQGGSRNAAVTIKILGLSGFDPGLAEIVSRRMARPPSGGVRGVGAGAMCAMWSGDAVDVRLGPSLDAGENATPTSPIWISFFDREALAAWRGMLPAPFSATYGCKPP